MACFSLYHLFALIAALIVFGGLWRLVHLWVGEWVAPKVLTTIRIIVGIIFGLIVLWMFYDLIVCFAGHIGPHGGR